MSDWYYMKRRWLGGTRKVGPLSDSDLLLRIDQGKITPETLLLSMKTKHKWVRMEEIGPAMKHWRQLHPTPDAAAAK
ncbi:MAG: DUF4339 domain-containing protein [Planctomycetaceae bacterium]